jgi:hypothetical protein
MDTKEKVRENKARRQAWRQGFILRKSRARKWSGNNYQGYMIIYAYTNYIEAGEKFDLSLEQVEEFLKEE